MTTGIEAPGEQAERAPAGPSRWERLIDAMDRPLLVVALVGVAFYCADLQGLFGTGRAQRIYTTVTHVLDIVFVIDLVLKVLVLRWGYIRGPWFLIDLISCTPAAALVVGGDAHAMQAIWVMRCLRVLRVLRTLRVLRVLRSLPAFGRFLEETPQSAATQRFEWALRIGVVSFAIFFSILIFGARATLDHAFLARVERELEGGVPLAMLHELGGTLEKPAGHAVFEVEATVDGEPTTVYFDHRPIDQAANQVEFFVVVGSLGTMALFLVLMLFRLQAVSDGQLRFLLSISLPKQLAEECLRSPNAYSAKHLSASTVMFMDFVGFTAAFERFEHRPDDLARHLEQAMDCVVEALGQHDIIIDKFIGDAIMCFRGGPLVEGSSAGHAYRMVRGALDSNRALANLGNPFFTRLKIGGATAENCLIGAFGTSTRLSYTVLGDGVNLAARLEPASGQCKTRNLFCGETRRLCGDHDDLRWRRWGKILVPGKANPLDVYEAFATEELASTEFIEKFEQGLEQFESRKFELARTLFAEATHARPEGDPPSEAYIEWCAELLADEPAEDWLPVLRTKK